MTVASSAGAAGCSHRAREILLDRHDRVVGRERHSLEAALVEPGHQERRRWEELRPVALGKEHGRSADRDHEIGPPVASEESKEIVHERRVLRAVAEAGRLERGLVYVDGLGSWRASSSRKSPEKALKGAKRGPKE